MLTDKMSRLVEKGTITRDNRHTNNRTLATLRTSSTKAIDKPVRPIEFSLRMSFLFVICFAALSALLLTVFVKARANGTYARGDQM